MKKQTVKPYNSGQWSEARYRSFIMSALRKAHWPVKYEALKLSRDGKMINPDTGKKCNAHTCPICKERNIESNMAIDHVQPIIPVTGHDSYDSIIERLLCELDGFQVICKDCHQEKSNLENQARREHKKKAKAIASGKDAQLFDDIDKLT